MKGVGIEASQDQTRVFNVGDSPGVPTLWEEHWGHVAFTVTLSSAVE